MTPKLQRRVQRYGWDKAAPDYERYWQRQLEPAQTRLLELAQLTEGRQVLDVACGTGLVTFPAARAVGPSGAVTATDISGEMIRGAGAVAAAQGLTNVTFERMDAEQLTFPDASFDVVLCGLGLMYVPDPQAALAEMLRVLRPGGRAVASVWGARRNCGWADIFPIVDERVNSEVCPLFFRLGTGEELSRTFTAAGFTDQHMARLTTTLAYDSPEDACGAAFVGGPVSLAHSRFDEPTRQEAYDEYLASIAPYQRNSGYEIPGEFVVVAGVKG